MAALGVLISLLDQRSPKFFSWATWFMVTKGLTESLGQFLRGEIAVPLKVKTFRNKVLEHSHELIHINELKGKVPVFEKEYAYEYQRPAVEPAVGKQQSLLA